MKSDARLVFGVMHQAATQSSAFDRGRVLSEVSPGRFKVSLASGAQIVCSSQGCYDPNVGDSVDLSKIHGTYSIEGPAAFG